MRNTYFYLYFVLVSEIVASAPQKPKRKAYLLKRKALTTSFFDANRKDGDKDKGLLYVCMNLFYSLSLKNILT